MGPNFEVRPAAGFAVFNEKYFLQYGWSGTDVTAVANYRNRKTEIQCDISEIQIVEIQI